jgi:hypothetical protein
MVVETSLAGFAQQLESEIGQVALGGDLTPETAPRLAQRHGRRRGKPRIGSRGSLARPKISA